MTTTTEARERLRKSHADRDEAALIVADARAAADRALVFADSVRDMVDVLREQDRSISVDQSLAIKRAIVAGEEPRFEPDARLAAHAASLAEAEARLRAAEVARAHLEAQAGDAAALLGQASDAVRAAAEAVLSSTADDLAAEIEQLETAALMLRVQLGGGAFAPIAVRGRPLSERLARVLRGTDALADAGLIDVAGEMSREMREAGKAWPLFVEALVVDADAELELEGPAPVEEEAQAA